LRGRWPDVAGWYGKVSVDWCVLKGGVPVSIQEVNVDMSVWTVVGAGVWVVCQGVGLMVLIGAVEAGDRLMQWVGRKVFRG